MINADEDSFIKMIKKKQSKKFDENEIYRAQKRIKEIDAEFQILFEKLIAELVVLRKGKVRRAKLNYIRALSTKAARIKERR